MAVKLNSEQKQVLSAFIKEGKRQGASYKQMKALVEAGLVESNLRNLNYGDRDSIGSLQERSHYGSAKRRLNPTLAARRFLSESKNAKGGTSGQLAQAVQRSAFPERYDQRGGDAASLLRGFDGGSTSGLSQGSSRGTPDRAALAQFLLQGGADNPQALQTLLASRTSEGVSKPSSAPSAPSGTRKSSDLLENFFDPQGGIKRGKQIGAIGGHPDHNHVAVPKNQLPGVISLAKKMGLQVTSTTGGKHTAGSYHYSGNAADFAGDPKKMAAFYRKINRIYGTR